MNNAEVLTRRWPLARRILQNKTSRGNMDNPIWPSSARNGVWYAHSRLAINALVVRVWGGAKLGLKPI